MDRSAINYDTSWPQQTYRVVKLRRPYLQHPDLAHNHQLTLCHRQDDHKTDGLYKARIYWYWCVSREKAGTGGATR